MGRNFLAMGFDEVKAVKPGEFQKLPAGAYICHIEGGYFENGNKGEMVILNLDIHDGGEFTGYFKKHQAYVENWDFNAQLKRYTTATDPKTKKQIFSPYLKHDLKLIQAENPRIPIDFSNFDPENLKGLIIGAIFRETEYLTKDNEIKTSTQFYELCSIKEVDDGTAKVPPIKRLPPDKRPAPKDEIPDTDTPF